MSDIKPWQIILIIAALLVLGFSLWKNIGKKGVDLPDSVLVVDVSSGDMYRIKLGKRNGAYFPERNPDTEELSLMPVVKDENGDWYIVGHALPTLEDVTVTPSIVKNAQTGLVEIQSEKVLGTLKAGQ